MHSDSPGHNYISLSRIRNWVQSACVLASPIPLLMLGTVVSLRHGFPTPTNSLVKMAGLSLLVLNVPGLGSKKRWMFSGPALMLITVIGISLVGLSRAGTLPIIGWALAGAGVLAGLVNLGTVARRMGLLCVTSLLLLGVALG